MALPQTPKNSTLGRCPYCGAALQDSLAVVNFDQVARNERHCVVLTPDAVLVEKKFATELSASLAALGLSQRKIPDWIATQVFEFEGDIICANGNRLNVHDELIDCAFGDDESQRWLWNFLRFHEVPPTKRLQRRLLPRLRLLDLAVRIAKEYGDSER